MEADLATPRRRVMRSRQIVYVNGLLTLVLGGLCALFVVAAAKSTPIGVSVAVGALAATLVAVGARWLVAGAYVRPDGVLIRNVFHTRRLAWGDIDCFESGHFRSIGTGCGIARLVDGSPVVVSALMSSLDDSAVDRALDGLNAELARASGREDPSRKGRMTKISQERWVNPWSRPWRIVRRVAWVTGFALLAAGVRVNYVHEVEHERAGPLFRAIFEVLAIFGACAAAVAVVFLLSWAMYGGERSRVWTPWLVVGAGIIAVLLGSR